MLQRTPQKKKRRRSQKQKDAEIAARRALFLAFIRARRWRPKFRGHAPTLKFKSINASTLRSREQRAREKIGTLHHLIIPKKIRTLLTLQLEAANTSMSIYDEAFDAAFDEMLLDIIIAAALKK